MQSRIHSSSLKQAVYPRRKTQSIYRRQASTHRFAIMISFWNWCPRFEASDIVKRIEAGEWTSLAVVSAYIRQAIRAHKATNCLTESMYNSWSIIHILIRLIVLFEQALVEAEELDAEFASTKRLRGPLHGIPVSFKDQCTCCSPAFTLPSLLTPNLVEIPGYDASIGFTQWAKKPCSSSAHLVSQFRERGAIIIAKTNVPQTMLSFECSNPIFGRTTNPWSSNAAHTCGGSSGGEAALLAQNGSALGVGSDIGGSLRIPTAYCGIFSLKPGWGRLSTDGARSKNLLIIKNKIRQMNHVLLNRSEPRFRVHSNCYGSNDKVRKIYYESF